MKSSALRNEELVGGLTDSSNQISISPRMVDSDGSSCHRSADASAALRGLHELAQRLGRIEQTLSVVMLIAARMTDITHVTVPEAARILGVSAKTVRRRVDSGALALEAIPGTKKVGIAIARLYDAGWWMPLALARQLIEDERREIEMLKRKSR